MAGSVCIENEFIIPQTSENNKIFIIRGEWKVVRLKKHCCHYFGYQ